MLWHMTRIAKKTVSDLDGVSKLVSVPGGGSAAGPFKSASIAATDCAEVADVDGLDMLLILDMKRKSIFW